MTNADKIFKLLKQKGYSTEGICAILGNLEAESNIENVRLEGDFSSNRQKSNDYMRTVDSLIDKGESVGAYCTDGKGWGLCQLTYPTRKSGFFAYCKSKGKSIGDLESQVEWIDHELQKDFPAVYKLCLGNDMKEACTKFLLKFENPANGEAQIESRYKKATKHYETFKAYELAEELESIPDRIADFSIFPKISSENAHDYNAVWVYLLRYNLHKNGYLCLTDSGVWDNALSLTLVKFQKDSGLEVTGICDTETWKAVICYV